jgi:hypothetical protein
MFAKKAKDEILFKNLKKWVKEKEKRFGNGRIS